ncbi:fimbrial protein [Bacteroides thetaiotaomicron]|nr:fimbrial protein [Bacteroides thetaiotaomicron]
MKKKNFLMLALAAVAFAACSNEDLVPVDNPGNNNDLVTDPNADAWVALAVKTPVQTRGLHNPNQEAATEDESKITKVRAIFFTANANEDAATVTADITLTDDEAGLDANGIPSGAAGKAFKVPATSKRILIIANPSPKFEAKTASLTDQKWPVGTTYATVNAALDDTSASMTTAGKFMMSNAKGSLEPSDEDEASGTFGEPVDLSLYATETAATNNPISIRIDRVVSKVRVYVTADSDAKATISGAGWVLNATNKTFFPVSKRTLTWNETPAKKPLGARGTCITPFDQYKIGSYRVDPNYSTQALANYNAYTSTSGSFNLE